MIKDRFPSITQYSSNHTLFFLSFSSKETKKVATSTRCTEERKLEKSAQLTLRNTRELRGANAYFERGHVVSSPCNIRGGGIGANNGTPAPATKQHSAGTTSSALSTGPQFVSVLLHNTRCGAVTRMRDEVLRCLITPPPVQTAFRGVGVGGGRERV